MEPFIPNFQSALQLVINSSTNILGTNLQVPFSKISTDAQNPLLWDSRPRLQFSCLKFWKMEQPLPKVYPEGDPTEENSFMCCERKTPKMWEKPPRHGGGICSWHDTLGKLEPMWRYSKKFLGSHWNAWYQFF